ncbi:MAG: Exodeoxyribonuclease 7 small subunit [Candidatus Dichloromethanomonas elyunquensis]|nr:MAG: Exodeoxyribonuclease 7 small subunit [Candidatus Dichloromethanomonas elyunquensis]
MNKDELKQSLTFETGIQRLEQIVRDLEQNNISLDEALELFGEGIRLVKSCNIILDSAEAKVKVLLEDGQGQLVTEQYVSGEN